jgi:ribosomal-protein-serine acetyltransferase
MGPAPSLQAGPAMLQRLDLAWVDRLDDAIAESLPELQLFMPWATEDHGITQTREYVERAAAEWDSGQTWNYCILLGADLVGTVGLMTRMGPGVLEIGYWVHSAHTGRGIATAAASSLAEVGLAQPGIERVVIKHDAANVASGRVAAKAGFTRVDEEAYEPKAPGQTGVMVSWERRG